MKFSICGLTPNLEHFLCLKRVHHQEHCHHHDYNVILWGLDGTDHEKIERKAIFATSNNEKEVFMYDEQHRRYKVAPCVGQETGEPFLWSETGKPMGYKRDRAYYFNFVWQDTPEMRNLLFELFGL